MHRERGYDVEFEAMFCRAEIGDKWGRRRTTADALEDGNLIDVLNETADDVH
jgi:hypothetical protein